jgi:glycolate oxidase iron-sulfur subunit
VQRVLAPQTDEAAARVLARQGLRVEALPQTGCCGALAYHMGKTMRGKRTRARHHSCLRSRAGQRQCRSRADDGERLLGVLEGIFACSPTSRNGKSRAEAFVAKVKDFTEVANLRRRGRLADAPVIAYHPPCSLQHGQRIIGRGEALLKAGWIQAHAYSRCAFVLRVGGKLQPAASGNCE